MVIVATLDEILNQSHFLSGSWSDFMLGFLGFLD